MSDRTSVPIEENMIPVGSVHSYLKTSLFDEKYSDVAFIVEGKKIVAHKFVMARSAVFAAMLFGPLQAQSKDVQVPSTLHPFNFILLSFCYFPDFT